MSRTCISVGTPKAAASTIVMPYAVSKETYIRGSKRQLYQKGHILEVVNDCHAVRCIKRDIY
jgi:adenylylsulfate kinase-like enzyme